jgi:molybdate transport system substrate-binding protein
MTNETKDMAFPKVFRNAASCVAALALVAAGGCSTQPSSPPDKTVTVFAAASLKKSFTEIGERFKTDNPGTEVELSFAGSTDLVTQLTQGASADVFASADTRSMNKAAQAGLLAGDPVDFATNTLTIVVAPGNPEKITALQDLTRPGLAVVVCAPQVPCGAATQKVQQAAQVRLQPVSEESQVTDVLNKVETGQAAAGLVYVTDVLAAGGRVTGVPFPESAGAVNTYPIAVLKQAKSADLARKFVELVTGETGRKILGADGFAKP